MCMLQYYVAPRRTLQYPIVRCSTHSDGAGSDHSSQACTLGCLSFVLRHRRSTVASQGLKRALSKRAVALNVHSDEVLPVGKKRKELFMLTAGK